jgi:hypothetical protein
MWDITVDGAHSFFVGTGGVLVHNCGDNLKSAVDDSKYTNSPRRPDIHDPGSLAHSTLEELDQAVPDGWEVGPSNHGGGVRWADPDAPGNAVRAMPGNPADPDPIKQMPYFRISLPGVPKLPVPFDW